MIKNISNYYKPIADKLNDSDLLGADVKISEKDVRIVLSFWIRNLLAIMKTKKAIIKFKRHFNIYPSLKKLH